MKPLRLFNDHRTPNLETLVWGNEKPDQDIAGIFVFENPGPLSKLPLRVIATSGGGWDHISVSTEKRCPYWNEMSYIQRLLAGPGETWMQLHVPPSAHVNIHEYTLHLWRPLDAKLPLPPSIMV